MKGTMIKISFEVSEDFIRESASPETVAIKGGESGDNPIKTLFNLVSFTFLENKIDEGKTEFVVTPDKLKDGAKKLYDNEIGLVCILAFLSEE